MPEHAYMPCMQRAILSLHICYHAQITLFLSLHRTTQDHLQKVCHVRAQAEKYRLQNIVSLVVNLTTFAGSLRAPRSINATGSCDRVRPKVPVSP